MLSWGWGTGEVGGVKLVGMVGRGRGSIRGEFLEGEPSAEVEGYGWGDRWGNRGLLGCRWWRRWCGVISGVIGTWLDGVLVEDWEHGLGMVPFAFAYGSPSIHRDPAFAERGVGYNALRAAQVWARWQARVAESAVKWSRQILVGTSDWEGDDVQRSFSFEDDINIFKAGEVDDLKAPFASMHMPIDVVQQQGDVGWVVADDDFS